MWTMCLYLSERHITFNHANTTHHEACAVHMPTIWKRNSLLRQKCSIAKHHHASTNLTFYMYHWKNLNYCKVPKTGSTFWMQVFLTLKKIRSVEDAFGNKRNQYHKIVMNKTSTLHPVSSNDVIFHVTRNPYSRLYSAYIDKIYLPAFWNLTQEINEKNGKECSRSVRFGEFLEYIMKEEVQNRHWQPVSKLFGSCRIPHNVISKQETFNSDVRFILNQLFISGLLKQALLNNLQKKTYWKFHKKNRSIHDRTGETGSMFDIHANLSEVVEVFPNSGIYIWFDILPSWQFQKFEFFERLCFLKYLLERFSENSYDWSNEKASTQEAFVNGVWKYQPGNNKEHNKKVQSWFWIIWILLRTAESSIKIRKQEAWIKGGGIKWTWGIEKPPRLANPLLQNITLYSKFKRLQQEEINRKPQDDLFSEYNTSFGSLWLCVFAWIFLVIKIKSQT